MLLGLGIFCLTPIYAAVTENVSITATDYSVSSFSFNISPLSSRKNVYPEAASFDTTGRVTTTTPVPAYTSDFIPWDNGYPINNWNRIINNQTQTKPHNNYIQICQFPYDYSVSSLRNKFLVSGITMNPVQLAYGVYGDVRDLTNCYDGEIIDTSGVKAFTIVISKTKAYCFYSYMADDGKTELRMATYSGSSWTTPTTISDSSFVGIWGVAGCLMNNGNDEYIIAAYPVDENTVSILSFKDGYYSSTQTINSGIALNNPVSGAQITITQNPRSGKVYLGWISGNKAFYKTGIFSPGSSNRFSFSSQETEICSISDSKATYACISAGSYNNFETSFTVSDDSAIRNYCLCGERSPVAQTLITESGTTSYLKYAMAFQYFEDGNYYSGCVCSSGFKTINFFRRQLEYPQACSWQAENKKLHIEGPPRLNTKVNIQVKFAEMVPATTLVRCVNSEFCGGVRSFDSTFNVANNKAVIASASGCFFALDFDKSMNTSLLPSELNTFIKLKESGTGNQITLSNVATSSGKLVFKPSSDLKLNTEYVINIASGVVDAVGSQIYKDEILKFKTQFSSTPLESEGVIAMEAFADSSYSTGIASGSDITANKKLYLRVNAYDPAFNTIDTTTVDVKKNGSLVTTLTLTQKTASSTYFYGEYQLSAPLDVDSEWTFQTVNNKKYLPLKVTYPVMTPLSPASAAVNVSPAALSAIEISASEELDPSSVNSENIKLLLQSSAVAATVGYDNASKKIKITPNTSLGSEKNYYVSVGNIIDKAGNKQVTPLVYYFSTSDTTSPTVTTCFPSNGATQVTIDSVPYIVFSEEIAPSTITKSNIKVTCNGSDCNYSLVTAQNKISIVLDGGLKVGSLYKVDVSTNITDFSGNHLAVAYSYNFNTQPKHTAPAAINSIILYRDSVLTDAFSENEKISASAKVYIKLNAVDAATQTIDIATVAVKLNGSLNRNIILYETASNSGGIFTGSLDLAELALYGYPTPEPLVDNYEINFYSTQTSSVNKTLNTVFPNLSASSMKTTGGSTAIDGAVNAYVDTTLTLDFSDTLDASTITVDSLKLASGSINLPITWSLSGNKKSITITPNSNLPFNSIITLSVLYGSNGIKNEIGNPIKGSMSLVFNTQKEKTAPSAITEINLYSDSSYSEAAKVAENGDFNKNGMLYIEAKGIGSAKNTIDNTFVIISSGSTQLDRVELTEINADSGIFRGMYQCSIIDDCNLNCKSEISTSILKNLIITTPVLTISPVDGAIDIPAAINPIISASEKIDKTLINASNIRLMRIDNSELINLAFNYSEENHRISIIPESSLALSREYQLIVENLTDIVGNVAVNQTVGFKIQSGGNIPVNSINSMNVFKDDSYSVSLASGATVVPGVCLWVEIECSTSDDTMVEFVSIDINDYSSQNKNYKISETGKDTNVYRGMIEIPDVQLDYFEIYCSERSNIKIGLYTEPYPVYEGFSPASETSDLYLNNTIVITANKDVDATTVSKANISLEGTNPLDYSVTKTNDKEITVTLNSASIADQLVLTLNSAVRDTSGLAFPLTIANYTTRNQEVTAFGIYSDSGYSNEISNNANVDTSQIIYCKVEATDLNKDVADILAMSYSVTGGASGDFNLTEESAGIYKGSFIVPNAPGKALEVGPTGFSNKKTLNIAEAFALVSYSPEDKAVGVAVDTWPVWNFNYKVGESQLTDTKFAVYKNGTSKVTGTLSLGVSGKQVRFQPASMLDTSTKYEMRLSADIESENGKKLGTALVATFTTQAPPLPPSNVFTFANYSDESYNVETSSVDPNGTLYLQLVAEDTSFSTYESTRVFIDSSDGTYEGVSAKLIETNPPSGIFRLAIPVSLPENSIITITPQAQANKFIQVKVNNLTKLVSLTPASGSADIYLDVKPSMLFSSGLQTSCMPAALKLSKSNGEAVAYSYSFESSNKKVVITPNTSLTASETYYVAMNSGLKDSSGQAISPFTYKFTTKALTIEAFDLYSDSGYSNKLVNNQDVGPGVTLYCQITGSDMTSLADSFEVIYSAADASNSFSVTETGNATGIYRGSFVVPATVNTLMTVYPKDFSEKAITLDILSAFVLESYSPADNAVNVPADVWPTWNFSRRIPESQLTTANFALYKVSDNSLIDGSISISGVLGNQVRYKPNSMLEKETDYKMVLSADLEDVKGKKLGISKTVTFKTQPPPLPPTGLTFNNYINEDYQQTTTTVIAGGKLYLQIKAENTSTTALEKINVIMDSDDGETYVNEPLELVETSASSKIFRLVYQLKPELEVGTKLTLIPQSEPAKYIVLDVVESAVLVNIAPASGSENIYLDTEFYLNFSNKIADSDLPNRVKIANSADESVAANYSLSADGMNLTIKPVSALKAGEKYSVYSTDLLVDGFMQPVKPFNCSFITKYESGVALELYTGIAPCDGHKVSETLEIVKGQLGIAFSTSDMLEKSVESRILHLSDMNYSADFELQESALNSNLYVATITVGDEFIAPPMKAEVMFGPKYQLKFDVATKTTLVSISPAENEVITGNANINAVYSRKVYTESAKNSTSLVNEASATVSCSLITSGDESSELTWKPKVGLSSSYLYDLTISGLKDYLGLDIDPISYRFYCGNEHNIYIYSDSNFSDKITTEVISNSGIYVEVVASSSSGLSGKDFYIDLLRGTATETLRLKLARVEGSDRSFRCCLKLADTMSSDVPAYPLGLYPGEWVKLSAPQLTSNEVLFYYRYSSGTEPEVIKDIRFFSEKTFVRKVTDEINNPSLYIEVEAEDLNWLTEDITKVRVTSDDDRDGFEIELNENGTHSDLFRGMITLSEKATDIAAKTLKVSFGKRVTVTSVTNPNVRLSVRYYPKAEIINFTPYPSPARRNYVNFRYFLNFATGIKITIYDVSGHKIDTIEMDGREGENIVRWNFPRKLANGAYIYRVKSMGTGDFYTHAKMVKGKFAVLR